MQNYNAKIKIGEWIPAPRFRGTQVDRRRDKFSPAKAGAGMTINQLPILHFAL